MGGCCGLVCGFTSEVIDETKDSCSLAVELPCDDAGDILAVSCSPMEAKMEADVGVISPFKVEANLRPVSRVQGELPVGLNHIC